MLDQLDHSGNASNSKVKDVVDFEAVLKSTDVQLPPTSQSVSEAQNQGTQDVLPNVFHSLQSAPGQNVESVRWKFLHTFPKRYASKFVNRGSYTSCHFI